MADIAEKIQALIAWIVEAFAALKEFAAGWEKHFAFEDAE